MRALSTVAAATIAAAVLAAPMASAQPQVDSQLPLAPLPGLASAFPGLDETTESLPITAGNIGGLDNLSDVTDGDLGDLGDLGEATELDDSGAVQGTEADPRDLAGDEAELSEEELLALLDGMPSADVSDDVLDCFPEDAVGAPEGSDVLAGLTDAEQLAAISCVLERGLDLDNLDLDDLGGLSDLGGLTESGGLF